MTKRVNTELARIRAASRAIKSTTQPETAVAKVQPALGGTLADARAIVARELEIMRKAQMDGAVMAPGDAKKLQALMSVLAATQTIEKSQAPDFEEMSDEDLDRELRRLQAGDKETP